MKWITDKLIQEAVKGKYSYIYPFLIDEQVQSYLKKQGFTVSVCLEENGLNVFTKITW